MSLTSAEKPIPELFFLLLIILFKILNIFFNQKSFSLTAIYILYSIVLLLELGIEFYGDNSVFKKIHSPIFEFIGYRFPRSLVTSIPIFIIFVLRDLLILLGAAFEMSITEKTPSPNLIGKITTTSQIIYILGLIIFEIFNVDINILIFHILIGSITLFSLISYFRWWLNNNFIKQNA